MSKLIIRVGSGGDGQYFASRSFAGMDINFDPRGMVFKLMQNDDEDMPAFEERVRQEARRRGISHVHRLDD